MTMTMTKIKIKKSGLVKDDAITAPKNGNKGIVPVAVLWMLG